MRPIGILFLIFLAIPIVEIYLLIQIGEVIGAPWTVAGVVATAVIGAWLVKAQGVITLHRAMQTMKRNEAPALEIVEGLFLLVAGALLITPGFVTDAIGFACLTPALRRPLAHVLVARLVREISRKTEEAARQGGSSGARTIDADYKDLN